MSNMSNIVNIFCYIFALFEMRQHIYIFKNYEKIYRVKIKSKIIIVGLFNTQYTQLYGQCIR